MASSTNSLPQHALQPNPDISDPLVSRLLASKRSLSCINHVWRANELVTSTRSALEASAITKGRTNFLRRGLDYQLQILLHIHDNNDTVANTGREEFEAMLQALDAAEARLRETLDLLRGTIVEASLRPEGEERMSLLDFVDEGGFERLMVSIKVSIDATNEARDTFRGSNESFVNDVHRVKALLHLNRKSRGSQITYGDIRSPIPTILHDLEVRAKDMAENLEMLVRHFDLCVTAIKYTEGGGAAAQHIAGDLLKGVGFEKSEINAHPEPMSDTEREEMMVVLERDANEVEDVVLEIKDHISDMESQYEMVTTFDQQLNEEFASIIEAFRLLEDIGIKLPEYLAQSHVFLTRWDEEKANIVQRMEELEVLRDFYDGFLKAYDNLIVEIDRRKIMQLKMDKLITETTSKIESLYEADAAEREEFRQDQGDFLPIDIWPGLMNTPMKYEILPVGKDVESVPIVSRSVIQQAKRRISIRR